MNQKSNVKSMVADPKQQHRFNALKWIVVCLLLIGGIVANTYYSETALALRAAAGIVLTVMLLFIAAQTTTGHAFLRFAKEARFELRKVVWPTRHETFQTTLVVVGMVVFAALILWGLDTLFFWLVGLLAGQAG